MTDEHRPDDSAPAEEAAPETERAAGGEGNRPEPGSTQPPREKESGPSEQGSNQPASEHSSGPSEQAPSQAEQPSVPPPSEPTSAPAAPSESSPEPRTPSESSSAPAAESSSTPASAAESAVATATEAPRATKKKGAPSKRPRARRALDFETLLLRELSRPAGEALRPGDRVRGRVVRIEGGQAYLEYGGASPAVLRLDGVADDEAKRGIEIGRLMTVTVTRVSPEVLVTRGSRLGRERARIRRLFQAETPVEGKVTGTNKGGFDVHVGGMRAFCPISQIDLLYCDNPGDYVGKEFKFKIIEFKDGGRRFVVSRRALLETDRKRQAEETRASLRVGDEVEGRVVRLQPFGAFVDIGGLEGLVHISELRHERVSDPTSVVRVGQTMRVKVIGLENLGTSGERVSLSAKALAADPWATVRETFEVGATVRGRVVRLVDYGAFVELVPGIEGLVHVSEFGGGRVGHPKEVVEVGQDVEVKVLRLDLDRRRISLSMRDAPLKSQLKVGALVEGTVASVKPYGVFIRIHEPAEGLDGMIPSAETEVAEGTSLSDAFPAGRAVQAKVVRVDARGRIRLSIRALREDDHPERREPAAGAPPRFGIMADAFKRARGR